MRSIYVIVGLGLLIGCGSPAEKSESSEAVSAPATTTVATSGDGAGLYATCIACHGENAGGNQSLGAPALANQDDWYLVRQLENFKTGIRGADPKDTQGVQMAAMAKTLATDEDVAAVVAHIKSLGKASTEKTIEGDLINGKQYYDMICGACHGPGAIGNKTLYAPKLVGTDDWYLLKQYNGFRDGIRGSHPDDNFGYQMQMMATSLDEKDAIDVMAYIRSLEDEI